MLYCNDKKNELAATASPTVNVNGKLIPYYFKSISDKAHSLVPVKKANKSYHPYIITQHSVAPI